jgi:hypothetical protein
MTKKDTPLHPSQEGNRTMANAFLDLLIVVISKG